MPHRLLLVIFMSCLLGCQPARDDVLVVAASANLRFAMEEIAAAYTGQTDIPCEMTVSSSGKLTAQIIAGAPYDVFLSADMKYPDTLHLLGLTDGKPAVYAYGSLVVWSGKTDSLTSLHDLTGPLIRHVALANPRNAPYGYAAEQVLRKAGIYDRIASKLVFGESISQVNQFVMSGAVQAGFTSRSTVLAGRIGNYGSWFEVPDSLYDPIVQGVALLPRHPEKAQAREAFRNFLFSEEGTAILDKFGYTPVVQ